MFSVNVLTSSGTDAYFSRCVNIAVTTGELMTVNISGASQRRAELLQSARVPKSARVKLAATKITASHLAGRREVLQTQGCTVGCRL